MIFVLCIIAISQSWLGTWHAVGSPQIFVFSKLLNLRNEHGTLVLPLTFKFNLKITSKYSLLVQ